MRAEPPEALVLYDGVCALCNGVVRFLLRIDRRRRLTFAPLQGATGRELLSRHRLADDLDTLVFVQRLGAGEEEVHLRSAAALRILARVGGVWRASAVLRLVPRSLRDRLYDWLASRRYRWFGRYDSIASVPLAERDRFLE